MKEHDSPNQYDLSVGAANLIHAIEQRYPDLTSEEVTKLGDLLMEEIAKRLAAGEQLAFLTRRPDGNAELTVWNLEIQEKASAT